MVSKEGRICSRCWCGVGRH